MCGRNLALAFVSVFSLSAVLSPCAAQPAGAALTPAITIDPSVAVLDKPYAVRADGRTFFVVGRVTEGAVDSVVGYTRTGKRSVSPIICDPEPVEALRLTVAKALKAQRVLAESAKYASYVIEVWADLKVAEETKPVHQAISAVMKVEVSVWDARDPGRVKKKFKMEAVGERKTFDTTKHAVTAAREAMRSAAVEILKSLDSL